MACLTHVINKYTPVQLHTYILYILVHLRAHTIHAYICHMYVHGRICTHTMVLVCKSTRVSVNVDLQVYSQVYVNALLLFATIAPVSFSSHSSFRLPDDILHTLTREPNYNEIMQYHYSEEVASAHVEQDDNSNRDIPNQGDYAVNFPLKHQQKDICFAAWWRKRARL